MKAKLTLGILGVFALGLVNAQDPRDAITGHYNCTYYYYYPPSGTRDTVYDFKFIVYKASSPDSIYIADQLSNPTIKKYRYFSIDSTFEEYPHGPGAGSYGHFYGKDSLYYFERGAGDLSTWYGKKTSSLGLNDHIQMTEISFFPNPAKDVIHLRGVTDLEYGLINANGQLVQNGILFDGTLDISNLPSGIYFLKVIVEDKPRVLKISKE